jgi:glycosyltransferase involved in cell wall biosynthesis
MKIVYVIHQFYPYTFGGVEIYTYDLAREMSRRGHDICVVSMPHKLDCKSPQYTYKKEKFNFIKIKNKKNHLKEFKSILRVRKPDIVHFQHLQYFSPRIIEITRALNIPMILHLHDYFYICKRIRLLTKDGKICRSNTNCPSCKARISKWKEHIDNIDLILANSHFARNIYIKSGFDPKKIMVNYNGIDTKRISKVKHSKSHILRFAFLGTVIKDKGIEVLIDVFNRLSSSASLEIWGRVNSYRCELLKRIKNPNIKIKGEYSPSNIKNVLSKIDIVVIPSIWPETWCNVKTEAFASGLGVLASSIGGIPEGIGDNKVLFFRPNNVNSLLKAIESVIANKDFWKVKKSSGYRAKTIKEDARKMEFIYSKLKSKYVNLSNKPKDNRYIVNSTIGYRNYPRSIKIYRYIRNHKWKVVYILQDVGARFWELFTEFKPFDEIAHTISAEYNRSKKEVEKDIKSFMNELRKEKVIVEAEKVKI